MPDVAPHAEQSPEPARGVGAVLLWACFLAASWTWVIGMLFPVLLVRDYGLAGWIVFAIPNVVGAAAMGFVIATPALSRRVVSHHGEACFRFSEICIALHVFAVGWAYTLLFPGIWGVMATGLFAVVVFMAGARSRWVLVATAAAVGVSLLTLLAWLAAPEIGLDDAPPRGALSLRDLALFTPAAVLGFILSPYLDLTFHRARQATTPTTGRWAFAVGFGAFFLAALVLSLLYARTLRPLFPLHDEPLDMDVPDALIYILAAHLTIQAGVTVALHLREIGERRGHAGLHRAGMLAIAGAALAWWAVTEPELYLGQTAGELVYRGFLLFFGLVFPAYVWLCMLPTRHPTPAGTRLAVYLVTLLFVVPMGYYGFLVGDSGWMLGGVMTLVVARLAVEWLPGDRQPEAGSG